MGGLLARQMIANNVGGVLNAISDAHIEPLTQVRVGASAGGPMRPAVRTASFSAARLIQAQPGTPPPAVGPPPPNSTTLQRVTLSTQKRSNSTGPLTPVSVPRAWDTDPPTVQEMPKPWFGESASVVLGSAPAPSRKRHRRVVDYRDAVALISTNGVVGDIGVRAAPNANAIHVVPGDRSADNSGNRARHLDAVAVAIYGVWRQVGFQIVYETDPDSGSLYHVNACTRVIADPIADNRREGVLGYILPSTTNPFGPRMLAAPLPSNVTFTISGGIVTGPVQVPLTSRVSPDLMSGSAP